MTQQRKKKDPFKVQRRQLWRVALANAALADLTLDAIIEMQQKINITMAKIASAGSITSMPIDFAANKIGKIADWGPTGKNGVFKPTSSLAKPTIKGQGHGHRQSLKWAYLHALYSEKVTHKLVSVMDRIQQAHDALCDKLDAQAGELTSVDFSDLAIPVLNPDVEIQDRSKASFETWVLSTMSSYTMTDDFMTSMIDCQRALNEVLAKLDSKELSMPNSVKVLDPKGKV